MNKRQRTILYASVYAIGATALFPPFAFQANAGMLNEGYSFLLSPPVSAATVNVSTLLMEWLAVVLIGGALWFGTRD